MLDPNVAEDMGNRLRKLEKRLKLHQESEECSHNKDCERCQSISQEINDINIIFKDAWSTF